jgi:plastocyanin
MRKILTLAAPLALVIAPAAHAQTAIVAGPGAASTSYLTPSVTMDQGEALTFYSFDAQAHDVTAKDKGADGKPLFMTPLIGAGDEAMVEGSQYLTAGSYDFFCSIHPNMEGTLTVTSAGMPKPRPSPGNPLPPDTTRPKVTLKVKSAGIAKVRRTRKLAVEVSVDEAAKVEMKATRGKTTIATGAVNLTGAGKRQETLKLTAAGRKALKGRARAAVKVTARAVDTAGNVGTAKVGRTLKR